MADKDAVTPEETSVLMDDAETGLEPEEGAIAGGVEETGEPGGGTAQWDSDDNPYKRQAQEMELRFKGLQGTVQRLTEQQKELLKGKEAEEEARFETELEGMTVTEAQLAREARAAKKEAAAARARLAELDPVAQAAAKQQAALFLAQKYGIRPDVLMEHDNPFAMEAFAKGAAAARAQLVKKSPGAVESSSSPGSGGTEQQLKALANTGDFSAWFALQERQQSRKR